MSVTNYSDAQTIGNNQVRLRVVSSGTSATCTFQFKRTSSSWYATWSDTNATLTFNGQSASVSYSWTGTATTDTWIDLCSTTFSNAVSTSGGTYTWKFTKNGSDAVLYANEDNVTISAQISAPTGLSASNITRLSSGEGFSATISVSDWGTSAYDSSYWYREFQVWTYNSSSLVEPRRYEKTSGSTKSSTITVDNDSTYGSLTIVPNTKYTLGMYATNYSASTGSTRIGDYTTLCKAPSAFSYASQSYRTYNTVNVVFNYTVLADGGAYDKTLYYSTDGSTWYSTGETISSSSETSGTITLVFDTDLENQTVYFKTVTSAGSSDSITTTVSTLETHSAPVISAWQLYDSNSASVAITGDDTVFIQGVSVPEAEVEYTDLTLYDSANVSSVGATFQNETIVLTEYTDSYGTTYYEGDFSEPSSSGTYTGVLSVTDSLGATGTSSLSREVLAYSAPTVEVSYVRSGDSGEVDVSFAGTYSPLEVSSEEKNSLTISYRLSDDSGDVLVDWTTVSATVSSGSFSGVISDVPTNYAGVYLVEVRVVDVFNTVISGVEVSAIEEARKLVTPQFDVEIWTRDNEFVADITRYIIGDMNLSWQLNDIEETSFDVSLDAMEVLQANGVSIYELLLPYAHDVRIRRNGDYIIGCQIVEANIKIDNEQIPKIGLKGTGYLNIFKDQYVSMPWAGYTYPVVAHKLIYEAQNTDSLIHNPTGDIDASYWLATYGTITQTTTAYEGSGAIQCYSSSTSTTFGTQMKVPAGTAVSFDLYVSGAAGSIIFYERALINNTSTQVALQTSTLSTASTYTHITGSFTTTYDDGYFVIHQAQTGTAVRVDNVRIYRTNDGSSANEQYVGCIYHGNDGGDTGTGTNSATSGYDSDREYNYDLQNVKDAIMDLTNMGEDNFDFEFTPDKNFNTYERKGSDRTDIEILYPGNVYSLNIDRSAADMANKVHMIGSGIGDERLEVWAYDDTSRATYGNRESIVTNNNVTLEDTLEGLAEGELADRSDIVPQITAVIQDGSINSGNIETGDVIPFKFNTYLGVLGQQIDESDTNLSILSDLEGWYKVKKVQTRVSQDSIETVTLTLDFEEEFEEPESLGDVTYYTDDSNSTTATVAFSSRMEIASLTKSNFTDINVTVNSTEIPMSQIVAVNLGSRVKGLPNNFLAYCNSLENVDISNTGINTVPTGFLRNSTNFNGALNFPETVTNVGSYFLYGASNFNQTVDLPYVTYISGYFLANAQNFNQSLNLPNVVNIGARFLNNASNFNQALYLPNAVQIGDSSMNNCVSFNSSVNLPEMTNIGNAFLLNAISFNQVVDLPKVTYVGDNFLARANTFDSTVSLPNAVNIGGSFLSQATAFNQPVNLPNVVYINYFFLNGATNFNSAINMPNLSIVNSFFLNTAKSFNQSLNFPNATTVGNIVLNNLAAFNQPIDLPKAVDIGQNFLSNTRKFNQTVNFPNVVNVGDRFLNYAIKLNSSVNLPNAVNVGNYFLNYVFRLNSSVSLPNVVNIGDYFMFYALYYNQPINFPGASGIGNWFMGHAVMMNQSVDIPNATSIGYNFMSDCGDYAQVFNVPANIQSIGGGFLTSCSNLTTVNVGDVNANVAEESDYTFATLSNTDTVYVAGLAIYGNTASDWVNRFPNRDTSPYRKAMVLS